MNDQGNGKARDIAHNKENIDRLWHHVNEIHNQLAEFNKDIAILNKQLEGLNSVDSALMSEIKAVADAEKRHNKQHEVEYKTLYKSISDLHYPTKSRVDLLETQMHGVEKFMDAPTIRFGWKGTSVIVGVVCLLCSIVWQGSAARSDIDHLVKTVEKVIVKVENNSAELNRRQAVIDRLEKDVDRLREKP